MQTFADRKKNTMSSRYFTLLLLFFIDLSFVAPDKKAWIRINQLGYTPEGIKVAVYAADHERVITDFYLADALTREIVYEGKAGKAFGA